MKTLENIRIKILELQTKELDETLTKEESIELGKLYIAEKIILKYKPKLFVKIMHALSIRDFNDFLNDNDVEVISMTFDKELNNYVIFYTEK